MYDGDRGEGELNWFPEVVEFLNFCIYIVLKESNRILTNTHNITRISRNHAHSLLPQKCSYTSVQDVNGVWFEHRHLYRCESDQRDRAR